jgi:phosphoserine phosphatase RsbU/P
MRVLVVDDETIVRQFIRLILERQGHETIEAHSAVEALRIAGQQECQFVITDYIMPGMSGPELIAQLARSSRLEEGLTYTLQAS